MAGPCPFCDTPATLSTCPGCGRSPGARRRICPSCKKMTPQAEPACCHCGARQFSELRWKIPAIIAMFVAAIGLSVVIQLVF